MAIFKGNNKDNILNGGTGDDRLYGYGGNDTLNGGLGADMLLGGNGNDLIKTDLLDKVDGGKGKDTLKIVGNYQTLDLTTQTAIKNVETIQFSANTHSTLKLDAQSVINLSSDSDTLILVASGKNTLIMDDKWVDKGIHNGYRTFSEGTAILKVDPSIGTIKFYTASSTYTITDATTAANVGSAFNSGVQNIVIDLGGKAYSDAGFDHIDLTGFGPEDQLVIAQHDGILHNGTAHYVNKSLVYITEHTETSRSVVSVIRSTHGHTDQVYWLPGATGATIISNARSRATTPSEPSSHSTTLGFIQITGLPAGLSSSHFVFI